MSVRPTYRLFSDKRNALELAELLTKYQIDFQLDDTSGSFDVTFAYNPLNNEYRIRLNKEDFKLADNALLKEADLLFNNLDQEYFIFSFTTEELMEIIENPDEWNYLDYGFALKILNSKGIQILPDELEEIKKKRHTKVSQEESCPNTLLVAGYLFSVFGGLLGIIIGAIIYKAKRTLPDGNIIYKYNTNDRGHGKKMIIIGSIIVVIHFFSNLTSNIIPFFPVKF